MKQERLQYIFDTAVNGVLTQGVKSVDPVFSEECAYRTPDGKKCAVGFLIDDEHYDPDIELNGVKDDIVLDSVEASLGYDLDGQAISMLGDLQNAHDFSDDDGFAKWFEIKARNIAEDYGIEWRF